MFWLDTLIGKLRHRHKSKQRPPLTRKPQLEILEDRFMPATGVGDLLPAVLTGTAYSDVNSNGRRDAGEAIRPGAVITLVGTDSQGATVRTSATADASGVFTFFQLKPGTYQIQNGTASPFLGGRGSVGNLGGIVSGSGVSSITIAEGQLGVNYLIGLGGLKSRGISLRQFAANFGSAPIVAAGRGTAFADGAAPPALANPTTQTATLSGFVYSDTNTENGSKDAGEAVHAGVLIALTGITKTGKPIFETRTTDANGAYLFDKLAEGTYTINVVQQPAGFRAGLPDPGNLGGLIQRNDQISGIDVGAGAAGTNYNFGVVPAATPGAGATPVVAAELANDTANPNGSPGTVHDNITSDPSIRGSVSNVGQVTGFRAGFVIGSSVQFVSIRGQLRSDGTFLLNKALLQRIKGSLLADGQHTIRLQAINSQGGVFSSTDVIFTLDTNAPAAPTKTTFHLDSTSDPNQDGTTDQTSVTLEGTTEAGAFVEVFVGGNTLTATATGGTFSFASVTLNPGPNNATVRVTDQAGNQSEFTTAFVVNRGPTVPTVIPDVTRSATAASFVIDLAGNFSDPDFSRSIVHLHTNFGDIDIELFDNTAAKTVANFFNYVDSNRFDSTIFHRSAKNFVLQGGGFEFVATPTPHLDDVATATEPTVDNEFGAQNTRGTVAMAKLGNNANSATSQFFFNLNNNTNLNTQNGGFTVFGQLVDGSDQRIVDIMAAIPTQNRTGTDSALGELPLRNYTGTNFPTDTTANNFLVVEDVEILRQTEELTYTVTSNTNVGAVTTTIQNNRLTLDFVAAGTATVTVEAKDRFGATTTDTFTVTVTA